MTRQQAETLLSPAANSARAARSFVDSTLSGWSCGEAVDVVVLLTSELVTNAVLHAGTRIGLRISRASGRLRVEVGDASQQVLTVRPRNVEAQTGRGLALVDSLATCWGVEQVADDGKVVWFEVDA